MSAHVHKLVRALEGLPPDYSADELDGVIADALSDVPPDEWPAIVEEATDRYCQEQHDHIVVYLARFTGTRH